jgi:KipI family sensor histidine kinase inhibitor
VSARRIRDAGDAAILLELDDVIDATVNARAIATAAAIRQAGLAGVRDVVSTFRSVAVYVDPLAGDRDRIIDALRRACDAVAPVASGRTHEVPVVYGGDEGPDLADVAACARLPVDAVVERHAARSYTVFMLGFLPGFAYMASVDPGIAAPRRATARVRVPAGSVGIAGAQTGIYPRESPGGWQIIGRTPVRLFDPARSPAALFAPGDIVRFVPTARDHVRDAFTRLEDGKVPLKVESGRHVTVIAPGLFTTVQDSGRWGHQSSGIPVAGPMDVDAHEAANRAVGNPPEAATLEATLTGPELRFDHGAVVAVTGADLGASIDGVRISPGTACAVRAASVLRFGERRGSGARTYVAFGGGIDVPLVLGSRATHVVSGLGGVSGRALVAGDRLPLGMPGLRHPRSGWSAAKGGAANGRLRVMAGPQDDRFPTDSLEQLCGSRFQIAPQSNRVGYRLSGARLAAPRGDMISDASFTGAIQVPPSGEPILLMADRATAGGYPQIATVISADLPLAGQLAPGDWVEFELCTREDAIAALTSQRRALRDDH